jgi:site-specific recombinase XerD
VIGLYSQKKIRLPKQKRLPHAIADAEVRKLLALTTNPLHRTCFALMYACGLRTGEAVSLEVPAINGRSHLLTIIGKGNKERLVPLPDPMLWSLRRLWQLHKNPRWLFPNRAGDNPIGRGTLNRTFSAVAQAAGIRSVTLHSFRHAYATRLLVNDFLPRVRNLHPSPLDRFVVKHPRWEPSARIGLARICAGGAQQWASLPRSLM